MKKGRPRNPEQPFLPIYSCHVKLHSKVEIKPKGMIDTFYLSVTAETVSKAKNKVCDHCEEQYKSIPKWIKVEMAENQNHSSYISLL